MLIAKAGVNESRGIFALLKSVDHKYFSRYSIAATLQEGKNEGYVNYAEKGASMQQTTDSEPYVTVTFRTPMIVTSYMIVNAYYKINRTYPTAWNITGRYYDEQEIELDSQKGIKFCELTNCEGIVKSFKIASPKMITSFTIKGTSNSAGNSYLIISSFDLFGKLCHDMSCSRVTCKCYNKRPNTAIFIEMMIALITR